MLKLTLVPQCRIGDSRCEAQSCRRGVLDANVSISMGVAEDSTPAAGRRFADFSFSASGLLLGDAESGAMLGLLLQKCPQLISLNVQRTDLSAAAFIRFVETVPSSQGLQMLLGMSEISDFFASTQMDPALTQLVQKCPTLKWICSLLP